MDETDGWKYEGVCVYLFLSISLLFLLLFWCDTLSYLQLNSVLNYILPDTTTSMLSVQVIMSAYILDIPPTLS